MLFSDTAFDMIWPLMLAQQAGLNLTKGGDDVRLPLRLDVQKQQVLVRCNPHGQLIPLNHLPKPYVWSAPHNTYEETMHTLYSGHGPSAQRLQPDRISYDTTFNWERDV